MTPQTIRCARVYDEPTPEDGVRVLVDRLWPRGMKKEAAPFDVWLKDAAPSSELRAWYGHDPEKFAEFGHRYRQELQAAPGRRALARLRELMGDRPLTLLTATKELGLSHVRVLAELLRAAE